LNSGVGFCVGDGVGGCCWGLGYFTTGGVCAVLLLAVDVVGVAGFVMMDMVFCVGEKLFVLFIGDFIAGSLLVACLTDLAHVLI
jgi:hypothetical protein